MDPIRSITTKHPKDGAKILVTADPQGFFNLVGGLIACGRCGSVIAREFKGQHFEFCRRLFRNLPDDSRIVTLGSQG